MKTYKELNKELVKLTAEYKKIPSQDLKWKIENIQSELKIMERAMTGNSKPE